MINTIKTKLIAIGSLILAIITLGGYARYQKHRADKATKEAKEAMRIAESAEMMREIVEGKNEQNEKTSNQHRSNARNRTFFSDYDRVRKENNL